MIILSAKSYKRARRNLAAFGPIPHVAVPFYFIPRFESSTRSPHVLEELESFAMVFANYPRRTRRACEDSAISLYAGVTRSGLHFAFYKPPITKLSRRLRLLCWRILTKRNVFDLPRIMTRIGIAF